MITDFKKDKTYIFQSIDEIQNGRLAFFLMQS